MTLSALRSEVLALRAHDLTETNIAAVEAMPGCIVFDGTDRDADLVDGLREDLAASEAYAKEVEAERDEWERRCMQLEAHAEEMRDRGELGNVVFDLRGDVERISERARDWAKQCEAMQRELSALRKRKGVEVALLAHWRDAWQLLGYVAQVENQYKDQAHALMERILISK